MSTAILISNVTIIVLMVVFGLWIRYIVGEQLKLKDAKIQSKDAEIVRLKGDTAPNITKAYETMKRHADEMTAQLNKLQTELDDKIKGDDLRYKIITEISRWSFEATGIHRANGILLTLFRERIIEPGRLPTVQEAVSVIQDASDMFGNEYQTRVNRLVAAREAIARLEAKYEEHQ